MSARTDKIEVWSGKSNVHVDQRPVYYWRYVSGNGRVLADSGQGYSRRMDALAGARRVTEVDLPYLPDYSVEEDGQVRLVWRVVR